MFARFQLALGLAILAALLGSLSVLAKGGFSFVTITGPGLKEAIHSTDPALTQDFFAFADFYRSRTEAPENPGTGYEITRGYMENSVMVPFDRLHYYPESGYVYYDGIVNGSSEYDDGWYTAKAEIGPIFEKALAGQLSPSAKQGAISQDARPVGTGWTAVLVVITGVFLLALLAFRSRLLPVQ